MLGKVMTENVSENNSRYDSNKRVLQEASDDARTINQYRMRGEEK